MSETKTGTYECADLEEAISEAKESLEIEHSIYDGTGVWLATSSVYNYGDQKYGNQLFVLQGTPSRGFVLAVDEPHCGSVYVYDGCGQLLAEYVYGSRTA